MILSNFLNIFVKFFCYSSNSTTILLKIKNILKQHKINVSKFKFVYYF